jgi:hypothetical protein
LRRLKPGRNQAIAVSKSGDCYGTLLPPLQPRKKKITHITRNKTNSNFAIPADAAAIPPNPKTAAISAIIRKVTAQPNIDFTSFVKDESDQMTLADALLIELIEL